MAIVGVIPARAGSKGLPGKNIKSMLGRPMISYIIQAALEAETLDRVVVSTDGEEIAAVAREYGAEVIMRPADIAGDTAPIEASLRHVIRQMEAGGETIDIAVLMQANVPIRMPGAVDEVVKKLKHSDHDSVVSVYEVNQRPEWMKKENNGRLEPFMHCEHFRRQLLPPLYSLDGAVMAVRVPVLMDTEGKSGVHVYLGTKVGFAEFDRIYSMDVDSMEDFAIVEAAMEYVMKRGSD